MTKIPPPISSKRLDLPEVRKPRIVPSITLALNVSISNLSGSFPLLPSLFRIVKGSKLFQGRQGLAQGGESLVRGGSPVFGESVNDSQMGPAGPAFEILLQDVPY